LGENRLVAECDWLEYWRRLVLAARRASPSVGDDPWAERAEEYHARRGSDSAPLIQVLEPWLSPSKTLIDVGAGTGRHAVPLAAKLDWVTAVEPSEAMRALIPPVDNMTVIASTWEDAEVAPADLVICSHVLYGVPEPVPFIEKLESYARERVFIFMRDEPRDGEGEHRRPRLQDLYNLLRQIGVAPDVTVVRGERLGGVAHWRPRT
jgi:2-polyprenyl-3-methyl-5-hydroxy-6-metoxy-1,4-benzoquinol methylase